MVGPAEVGMHLWNAIDNLVHKKQAAQAKTWIKDTD
jgi:hypothetical protein